MGITVAGLKRLLSDDFERIEVYEGKGTLYIELNHFIAEVYTSADRDEVKSLGSFEYLGDALLAIDNYS